jgi:hypothetical protein
MSVMTHRGVFVWVKVGFSQTESKPECVFIERQESSGCVCYHILFIFLYQIFCNFSYSPFACVFDCFVLEKRDFCLLTEYNNIKSLILVASMANHKMGLVTFWLLIVTAFTFQIQLD